RVCGAGLVGRLDHGGGGGQRDPSLVHPLRRGGLVRRNGWLLPRRRWLLPGLAGRELLRGLWLLRGRLPPLPAGLRLGTPLLLRCASRLSARGLVSVLLWVVRWRRLRRWDGAARGPVDLDDRLGLQPRHPGRGRGGPG